MNKKFGTLVTALLTAGGTVYAEDEADILSQNPSVAAMAPLPANVKVNDDNPIGANWCPTPTWKITGAEMAKFPVIVTFAESGMQVATRTWTDLGGGQGKANGSEWSLTQTGDTWTNQWTLTSSRPIKSIEIRVIEDTDGNGQAAAFDRINGAVGTPGSINGKPFTQIPDGIPPGVTATYSWPVIIPPPGALQTPHDLYGVLTLDFDPAFVGTVDIPASLSFLADTDCVEEVIALPMGGFELPKGSCCLDYDRSAPEDWMGHPDFNQEGFNQPDFPPMGNWKPDVIDRFVSCYVNQFPGGVPVNHYTCKAELGKWHRAPKGAGEPVEVVSAHWFAGVSWVQLKKLLGYLPTGVKLLATGVELTATKNGNGVDLTLTTDAEPDTAKLLILREEKRDKHATEITVVCEFPSGGSPYTCTDNVVGDHYRAGEIEYDGSFIVQNKAVKPKKAKKKK